MRTTAGLLKLHRQLGHAPYTTMLRTLQRVPSLRIPDLEPLLNQALSQCECRHWAPPPNRPVVTAPSTTRFNEEVRVDILFLEDRKMVLHILDAFSGWSAGTLLPNKRAETVLQALDDHWFHVFDYPERIRTDLGGEFDNETFEHAMGRYGITVLPTSRGAWWSHGQIERGNRTLGTLIDRLRQSFPHMPVASLVPQAFRAKRHLASVGGFSPYQIVLGQGPRLPPELSGFLSAEGVDDSGDPHIDRLIALKSARNEFIKVQTLSCIRQALRTNLRPQLAPVRPGDAVWYWKEQKGKKKSRWVGPATVLGQTGTTVYLSHGSRCYRVHRRLLRMRDDTSAEHPGPETSEETNATSDEETNATSDPPNTEPEQLQADEIPVEDVDTSSSTSGDDAPRSQHDESPVPDVSNMSPSAATVPSRSTTDDHPDRDPRNPWRGPWWKRVLRETGAMFSTKESGSTTVKTKVNNPPHLLECSTPWWHSLTDQTLEEISRCEHAFFTMSRDNIAFGKEVYGVGRKDTRFTAALDRELDSWKSFGVYERVKRGSDTPTVGCRMIYIFKQDADGEPKAKCRLVVQGFQDPFVNDLHTYSPTVSKTGIKLAIAYLAQNRWPVQSVDIHTAFLQGKPLARPIYLNPPPEAKEEKGIVWKLNKPAYGLGDAGERFWERVKDVFVNHLNLHQSRVDVCVFFRKLENGTVDGVIVTHVDDFLWGGSVSFAKWFKEHLPKHFLVKEWETDTFYYSGMKISNDEGGDTFTITLDLNRYIEAMTPIDLQGAEYQDRTRTLTSKEVTMLRSSVGEFLWVGSQTRPDIMFDTSELASAIAQPRVEHLFSANKLLQRLKKHLFPLCFRALGPDIFFRIYCDASWGNRDHGHSQGGGFVCLVNKEFRFNAISWFSRKIRRVVRSTFGGETLASVDAVDEGLNIALLWDELNSNISWRPTDKTKYMLHGDQVPVHLLTDCKSLFDHLKERGSRNVEKRLAIDLYALREHVESGAISHVCWVPTEHQLADGLTKSMNQKSLVHVLTTGQIPPWSTGKVFTKAEYNLIKTYTIENNLSNVPFSVPQQHRRGADAHQKEREES